MRKLPISARQILVPACVILAISLNLALTRVGHQVAVAYCDYRFEVKSGPVGDPIIPLVSNISDTFCMGPSTAERSRSARAFSEIYGIFPARNISAKIALWGGVLAPFAMILCAAFIALRAFLFPARAIALVVLAALGILTTTIVVSVFIDVPHGSPRYWGNHLWPLVIPLGFFLGAYWLWRNRSPKQPT